MGEQLVRIKIRLIITGAATPQNTNIMTKSRTEQVVRELFRDSFHGYPESYTDNLEDAVDAAKVTAEGYFENRTEEEYESDSENGITLEDYQTWCVRELPDLWEFYQVESRESGFQIDNVSDLEEWTGQDISGKYDFDQLVVDHEFHFSCKLQEGDEVNFIFDVEEMKGWDSVLNLKQVELI